MADGWERHTEEEFSLEFRILLDVAVKQHGLEFTEQLRGFLIQVAQRQAQQAANERQLMAACHVPGNWKKIWARLEELGIQEEFKL